MMNKTSKILTVITELDHSYVAITLFCSVAATVLVMSWKIYRAFASPLRGVQGPLFARFSRLWLLKEVYYGTFMRTSIELHGRYGPIVRIAPNEYSIDDPAAMQIIYGSKGRFTKASMATLCHVLIKCLKVER